MWAQRLGGGTHVFGNQGPTLLKRNEEGPDEMTPVLLITALHARSRPRGNPRISLLITPLRVNCGSPAGHLRVVVVVVVNRARLRLPAQGALPGHARLRGLA